MPNKIEEIKARLAKYKKDRITTVDGYTFVTIKVERYIDDVDTLIKELNNARNELCLKCGKYTNSHDGACDGCKWDNIKAMLNYM